MEILDISQDAYHALEPHISSSMLRCFKRDGEWQFYNEYIAKTIPRKESDTQRLGRIFHRAMEDRNTWEDACHVFDEKLADDQFLKVVTALAGKRSANSVSLAPGTPLNRHSPQHRQYEELRRAHYESLGFEWLLTKEHTKTIRMIDATYDNTAVAEILEEAQRRHAKELPTHEVVMTDTHEGSGLLRKAMLDLWLPDYEKYEGRKYRGLVLDFKTTVETTSAAFIRAAKNFGYFYQASHYHDVSKADIHLICAVRNEAPYETMLYSVHPDALEWYVQENNESLKQLAACMRFGGDAWHTDGHNCVIEINPVEGMVRNG